MDPGSNPELDPGMVPETNYGWDPEVDLGRDPGAVPQMAKCQDPPETDPRMGPTEDPLEPTDMSVDQTCP